MEKMRKALRVLLLALAVSLPVSVYAANSVFRQPSLVGSHWTDLAPPLTPPNGYYASIAYDSKADRVIYLVRNWTGPGYLPETWAYNLTANAWTKMKPSLEPPAGEQSAMVYDSRADRVILFGGMYFAASATLSSETWAYDLKSDAWTSLHPVAVPPARAQHRMVYDERYDRVVMFGGSPGTVCCDKLSNDTWVYDFNNNTWTEMQPAARPPARTMAAMAYDSRTGLIVLFGGQIAGANRNANDTWTYDLTKNTWTNVTAGQAPRPMYAPGMVYDADADRIVLFGGGSVEGGYSNQTWIYDPGAKSWARVTTDPTPIGRYWPNLVYDSAAKAVVLVGGFWFLWYVPPMNYGFQRPSADTWHFDFGSA